MKTFELRGLDGRLVGFSVRKLLLGRHRVQRVVAAIPGATFVRKQAWFAPSGSTFFCEFVVGGKAFLVVDPFGNSPEFSIVTEPPEECAELNAVLQSFQKHRPLGSRHAG